MWLALELLCRLRALLPALEAPAEAGAGACGICHLPSVTQLGRMIRMDTASLMFAAGAACLEAVLLSLS